jgi:hypothetical protein
MSDADRLATRLAEICSLNEQLIHLELQIAKRQEELAVLQERRHQLATKLQFAIQSAEPVNADAR